MDEQLRIILIIIVSVSIFGLLVFVFVKNVIRNRIQSLVEQEEKEKKLDAQRSTEKGGPKEERVRFGDWEKAGRAVDF